MERESDFFHIEEIEQGAPPPQYGEPHKCRYCRCKLNRYNPLDACHSCRNLGLTALPRDEIRSQ